MASLERVERTRQLYRGLVVCSLLLFAWTQSGCEKDLADLPISDSLTLEWGDSEFVVSEPILTIPLKQTKVTKKKKKKKKKYELNLKTSNGNFSGWAIAAELKAGLKVKKGQVVGLKKKGSKCSLRHISDGMPSIAKFKLIRKESEITGQVGEKIAFKLLCRKSKKRDKDGKIYAEGVPYEVWVTGSMKPKWL